MKNKKLLSLALTMLITGCQLGTPSTPNSSPVSSPKTEESSKTSTSSSVSSSTSTKKEEPLTVELLGNDVVWYDETLTLTPEFNKETSETVVWESSDPTVATVADGIVTPLKAGTTTITVKVASDATISASKEITVKDVIIDTSVNDGGWDFSNLKSDNPTIKTNGQEGSYQYEKFANFKHISGQKYYAEATFKMTSYLAGNTWNRIAVGHRNMNAGAGEVSFRAYHASYGQGGDSIKTVVMETPITWGADTDRSQVWNQGGRKSWDFSNIKLATLRTGNTYYYYVNDELSWVESINERFNNIDTVPAITASDMNVEVSNMFATDDETFINEKLESKESNKKFWSPVKESIVIDESGENPSIKFDKSKDNSGNWPSSNIKDYAARPMGDTLYIPARGVATFEYDYKVTEYSDDTDTSLCGMSFTQYTNGKEVTSILLGKYHVGGNTWGWDGGMNAGANWVQAKSEDASLFKQNETYRIKIVVNGLDQNGYRYTIYSNDNLVASYFWDWNAYTNILTVSITALNISAEVNNFTYTIA